MAIQIDYPGVYIDEFTPSAPIDGVGTSTAAFLAPWKYGEPNQAKKLFSWDDFLREFGNPTGVSEPPADDDYLYYAVRGFFQNGGKTCYVTRVSNATADSLELNDEIGTTNNPKISFRLVARAVGVHIPQIQATIAHTQKTTSTLFYIEPIALTGDHLKNSLVVVINIPANEVLKFKPEDVIVIGKGTTLQEEVVVEGISQTTQSAVLHLKSGLKADHRVASNTANNDKVELANPTNRTRVIRVADSSSMSHLTSGSAVKLSGADITTPIYATVQSVSLEVISATLKTWRVTLQNELGQAFDLTSNLIDIESQEFDLTINPTSPSPKNYDFLSMNPGHPRYFYNIINGDPNGLVNAVAPNVPNTTPAPNNRPKVITTSLIGGALEDRATIGMTEYGDVLANLARIDDINIVSAPGVTDAGVQALLREHCDTHTKDRFAVLDSWRAASIAAANSVTNQIAGLQSNGGYAALYYPWLVVSSARESGTLLVPPSGHVAGVYARTDSTRGVHKAPAGTEAILNGALGVEKQLTDNEQGDLNKTGVNVIRVFQSGGSPIIWGARTTATQQNKNWQYINVRRLFIFLEESIQEGIRWAVFEPNNLELWGKLKTTITAFLTQQWRDGALFGASKEEAFYVRIDEALNPPDQRALGKLTIEIGVKPVYPAEFIVVRIGIWQGGSEITQ